MVQIHFTAQWANPFWEVLAVDIQTEYSQIHELVSNFSSQVDVAAPLHWHWAAQDLPHPGWCAKLWLWCIVVFRSMYLQLVSSRGYGFMAVGGLFSPSGGAFVVPLIIGCKRVKPYTWSCGLGFKDGISFHDVGPCGVVLWGVLRRGGFGLQYHFAVLVIKVWPIVAGVFLAETFWFCCKKASVKPSMATNYRSISWVPKKEASFVKWFSEWSCHELCTLYFKCHVCRLLWKVALFQTDIISFSKERSLLKGVGSFTNENLLRTVA